MTRSSHSQWSPIGHDDAIGPEERAPHIGALQADGAPGAVRDSTSGDLVVALSFKFFDGEDLPVEIGEAAPVGAEECEGPVWGAESQGRVATLTPKTHVHLPGEQPPEDEVRHRDLGGLLAPHDGDDGGDDSDGDDGGDGGDGSGHFWPFLLIPAELLLAS